MATKKKLIKKKSTKKVSSRKPKKLEQNKGSSRKPRKITTLAQATRMVCETEKPSRAQKQQETLERQNNGKLVFKASGEARIQAEIDYIMDDQQRSLEFHYDRPDRNYPALIKPRTFRLWSEQGDWVQKRADFWESIKTRVLEELEDQIFQKRMEEIGQLQVTKELFYEFLQPLRDEDGEIVRDEETGKPKFALQLPSLEGMTRLILTISERQSILRGDVISRSEEIHHGVFKVEETKIKLDPIAQLSNLTEEQAHKFARALMAIKNPHLKADMADVIDVEADDDESS